MPTEVVVEGVIVVVVVVVGLITMQNAQHYTKLGIQYGNIDYRLIELICCCHGLFTEIPTVWSWDAWRPAKLV